MYLVMFLLLPVCFFPLILSKSDSYGLKDSRPEPKSFVLKLKISHIQSNDSSLNRAKGPNQ